MVIKETERREPHFQVLIDNPHRIYNDLVDFYGVKQAFIASSNQNEFYPLNPLARRIEVQLSNTSLGHEMFSFEATLVEVIPWVENEPIVTIETQFAWNKQKKDFGHTYYPNERIRDIMNRLKAKGFARVIKTKMPFDNSIGITTFPDDMLFLLLLGQENKRVKAEMARSLARQYKYKEEFLTAYFQQISGAIPNNPPRLKMMSIGFRGAKALKLADQDMFLKALTRYASTYERVIEVLCEEANQHMSGQTITLSTSDLEPNYDLTYYYRHESNSNTQQE